MKIGFYGDSFCRDKTHPKYETYISLLLKHYNAELTHLGFGGSSQWDLIIEQFQKDEHNLPDVCIFTWTEYSRLYHNKVRHIKAWEALEYADKKFKITPTYSFGLQSDVWKSAEAYYKHIYDDHKSRLEYASSLYYFDNVILEAHKNTKFIHLWSYGDQIESLLPGDDPLQYWEPNNLKYLHTWRNGVEIRPSLMSIATRNGIDYEAANHIPGNESNMLVFEQIKKAIEEYK